MLYYSEMQNMQNICFINFTRKFEIWDFANRAVNIFSAYEYFPTKISENVK